MPVKTAQLVPKDTQNLMSIPLKIHQSTEFSLNRRTVLTGLLAFGVSPSHANVSNGIHEIAAKKARELAKGEPLNLRLLVPEGTGRSIDIVIDEFFKATGVRVLKNETSVNDINIDLALDHLSQSNAFDMALPATFAVSDLAEAGAIIPITEYANRYEPSSFRDGILYQAGDQIDGATFGFQADGDAYLMFYNRDMLESSSSQEMYAQKFGTPLSMPRTWNELDRQIEFFHQPEKDQFGGLLFRTAGYVAWEWWVRFHAKGLWPFTSEMEPLIASDAGVAALEEMIAVTEHLKPSASYLDLFGNWKAYAEGNTYANFGWGGSQKYFNGPTSNIRGKVLSGTTPGGVINGELLVTPYFNWGWTYVVSASCQVPEIAYLFNLFASSPHISTLSVRQSDGFFDPFRPEHYEDAGIQAAYSNDFLKVHRESLEKSIPDLYLPRQGDYFQALGEWLYRALIREVTPKAALEAAAQRWNAITRNAGKAGQIQHWQALKQTYPEAVSRKIERNLMNQPLVVSKAEQPDEFTQVFLHRLRHDLFNTVRPLVDIPTWIVEDFADADLALPASLGENLGNDECLWLTIITDDHRPIDLRPCRTPSRRGTSQFD